MDKHLSKWPEQIKFIINILNQMQEFPIKNIFLKYLRTYYKRLLISIIMNYTFLR